MSASSSASDDSNDIFYTKSRVFDRASCCNKVIHEEKQLSLSDPLLAPRHKFLSHLDQVANDKARSLKQRFVDQRMLSSESDGLSEDERNAGTKSHRPSIGINSALSSVVHSSVNFSPRDPYCQPFRDNARRNSTSAVFVIQSVNNLSMRKTWLPLKTHLAPGN